MLSFSLMAFLSQHESSLTGIDAGTTLKSTRSKLATPCIGLRCQQEVALVFRDLTARQAQHRGHGGCRSSWRGRGRCTVPGLLNQDTHSLQRDTRQSVRLDESQRGADNVHQQAHSDAERSPQEQQYDVEHL
jgi:hypothetical protein